MSFLDPNKGVVWWKTHGFDEKRGAERHYRVEKKETNIAIFFESLLFVYIQVFSLSGSPRPKNFKC